MRTAFLGLVFLFLIRTISAKDDCTRAEMEACTKIKQIYHDAAAAASKDLTRTDTYTSRDDHDGTHCDDCCLYSKDGEPETLEGRKYAYCMDEGNCDLCVDSCNTTCSCQRPDQSCWEWEDCSTNTIQVGTTCKAVCTENRNETKTFTCQDAELRGLPAAQSTVSSLANTGATNCEALWMYENKVVTPQEIVMMGEETCSGYCDHIDLDKDTWIVTCENWLNESMVFNSSEPDKVKSEGVCIVKCKDHKLNNETWTYLCFPPSRTVAPLKCGVKWHNNAGEERTVEQIKDEIKDLCNDNGTTSTKIPLPDTTTTTLPPIPPTTTTTPPPTTTPPYNCKGDCTWPPFNDPLGTWNETDCKLLCEPPPGGQIAGLPARIPPLVAECSAQQWSYSTIIENGTEPVPDPTNYTDNDTYCPKTCTRPPTCPASVLQGKPNPCEYICTVKEPVNVAKGDKIYSDTKCQLQCFNETVMSMIAISGPKTTTPSLPIRRKRQATLPGDITTPIIETTSDANGITPGSTPIIETTSANGITPGSTPIIETTTSAKGITPGGVVDNPMAEVLCNNDTQLIGADGQVYVYNEQDPRWVELCDNNTAMVFSKMVYSENDIGGDFPLFNDKDGQEPAKPAWENLWCTNVMLDQWSRVSPKGLATGYDKEKDPETTSSFFRKPNPPNRTDPKSYDNRTRRMPDDDQFYHLLMNDTYKDTNEQGEVEVGGFPPLNLALQAFSELTWKSQGPLYGKNKTHGYYEGIYQQDNKDQINHYFTDNFYLTVGEGELDPLMKRKLVRKVNIWVPIFDDKCFDYCGPLDDNNYECKKKCKPLDKAALDALGVTVTIKCTSCETDPDELVKYYYNSTQTQRNIWHDNLTMYPQGDESVNWVGSEEAAQPMYTAVGPPGLWEVQCSVDPAKGADYITTNGNSDVQPQRRWLRENTMIPCSLNLKLNKNTNSVTNWPQFKKNHTTPHKELMKLSLDWSLPNERVAASLGFSYILFTGTGKGLCVTKEPDPDDKQVVKWRCYDSEQDKAAEKAKNQTKQSSKDTPIAVQATESKHEWNCAVLHDNPNKINKIPMTILHGDKNSIGIGYSLNRRCCTVVKTKSFQCEDANFKSDKTHVGNNLGVGPSSMVLTDKIFTDIKVNEDEEFDNEKNLLIIVNNEEHLHLQSQLALSVQYVDETGKEKLDRINIERGTLHSRKVAGASHVMMCVKLNGAGKVIKMERPYNKWIHNQQDSSHISFLQYEGPDPKEAKRANNVKCGQCFDLFCNWNTTEKQADSEWAKFQCCRCAKKLNLWNKEEEVLKSRTPLEDTDFDRETQPVRCPWPGVLKNPRPKPTDLHKECTCDGQAEKGASRSIKAQGPKDAREFEPQVLRLENDDKDDEDDGGAPRKAEGDEEEEGGDIGKDASSKEYFEEAEDVSYLGANQDLLEEAEEKPL